MYIESDDDVNGNKMTASQTQMTMAVILCSA